jgi:hypothetical protein
MGNGAPGRLSIAIQIIIHVEEPMLQRSLHDQPPSFEDYAKQEFIKILLQTPPDGWNGIMLMKGQVAPIQEMAPGVSETHYDFVMQVDGVADLETRFDYHHIKSPAYPGNLTFVPCYVPIAFQSNATVQNFGCLSDKHLWSASLHPYLRN